LELRDRAAVEIARLKFAEAEALRGIEGRRQVFLGDIPKTV
jgi:hypothetical protein